MVIKSQENGMCRARILLGLVDRAAQAGGHGLGLVAIMAPSGLRRSWMTRWFWPSGSFPSSRSPGRQGRRQQDMHLARPAPRRKSRTAAGPCA